MHPRTRRYRLCHVRRPFIVYYELVDACSIVESCCRYRDALYWRCSKRCLRDKNCWLLAKMKQCSSVGGFSPKFERQISLPVRADVRHKLQHAQLESLQVTARPCRWLHSCSQKSCKTHTTALRLISGPSSNSACSSSMQWLHTYAGTIWSLWHTDPRPYMCEPLSLDAVII